MSRRRPVQLTMGHSITFHSLWPRLAKHMRVEVYDRDGSARKPRIRIEWVDSDELVTLAATALKIPCVHCGADISPIRERVAESKRSESGHYYVAVTCPLSVRIGCSRSKAAKVEYERIKKALRPDLS